MRVLVFAFVGLFGSMAGAESFARATATGQVQEILSFHQWMDLPPAKREAYIEGLQKILAAREAAGQARGIEAARAQVPDVREVLWAMLLASTPAIAADPASCGKINFVLRGRYGGKLICVDLGDDTGPRCSAGAFEQGGSTSAMARQCPEKFKAFADAEAAKLSGRQLENFQRVRAAVEPKPEEAKPAEVKDGDKGKPDTASTTRCGNVGVKCEMQEDSHKDVDHYRQAYRAEMEKLPAEKRRCAISGFVSTLSKKQKCSAIREWKIGAHWTGKCASNETMCNPMVFGFQEDGKAICIKLGQNVTNQCQGRAQVLGNNPKKIAEQLMGKTEATKKIPIDDLADRWREFREGLTALCEPGASLEFHCNECATMDMQIRNMNMVSTCADKCGRVAAGSEAACRNTFKAGKGGGGGEATIPVTGER